MELLVRHEAETATQRRLDAGSDAVRHRGAAAFMPPALQARRVKGDAATCLPLESERSGWQLPDRAKMVRCGRWPERLDEWMEDKVMVMHLHRGPSTACLGC